MSWNYRIFKQAGKTGIKDKNGKEMKVPSFLYIGECYYDDNNKPEMHSTMDHNLLGGDNKKELKEVYDMIAEAFKAPIIKLDEDGKFIHE